MGVGSMTSQFPIENFFSFFPILKCGGEKGTIKIMKSSIQTLFLGK
jgi:hypothetical protein